MKNILVIVIMFFGVARFSVYAATPNIRINELLIDPTQSVELYNNEIHEVDISGWHIDDNGGTTYFTVPPNTVLAPQKCVVFTSSFNLNKSTPDVARLFDSTAAPTDTAHILVDSFSYAESPGANRSYQRIPDGTSLWATASASLGLQNIDGSNCVVSPSPSPTPSPTAAPMPSATITPSQQIINNVYISEAGVNPLSTAHEWVELINDNEYAVVLDGWFVDDILSGGATKVEFSRTIGPKSYSVIEFETSLFNNTGDEINLLNSDGELIDAMTYQQTVKGQSVGRTERASPLACIMQPTLALPNSTCITATPPSTPTPRLIVAPSTPKMLPTTSTTISPVPESPALSSTKKQFSPPTKTAVSTPFKNPKTTPHAGSIRPQTITINSREPRSIARTLSFSSLTASILTIVSLLFKIKGG